MMFGHSSLFFQPMHLSIRGTSDAVNGYFVSTRVLRFYFILGAFLSFIHNCVGSSGPRSKVISHIETLNRIPEQSLRAAFINHTLESAYHLGLNLYLTNSQAPNSSRLATQEMQIGII